MKKFFYYNELSYDNRISAQRSLVKLYESHLETTSSAKPGKYDPSLLELCKKNLNNIDEVKTLFVYDDTGNALKTIISLYEIELNQGMAFDMDEEWEYEHSLKDEDDDEEEDEEDDEDGEDEDEEDDEEEVDDDENEDPEEPEIPDTIQYNQRKHGSLHKIGTTLIFAGLVLAIGPLFGLTIRNQQSTSFGQGLLIGIISIAFGVLLISFDKR